MKKSRNLSQFVCQNCGNSSPRWIGKCPSCGEWNTYTEERMEKRKEGVVKQNRRSNPQLINEIEGSKEQRIPTHIGELDRVLGGGCVPGSVVLVGGDPGIGKSTIALQMLDKIASSDLRVLYATGEESPEQVKLRAKRTGVSADNLFVYAENSVENILEQLVKLSPKIAVVDSIQAVYTEDFPSAPGSVGQIRECTAKIMQFAKSYGVAIFLIGHVTKEGSIAGPRVLEHLVDTVFYFEGERDHRYRILRAVKNRFGSTNEIGVFEMQETGLKEVKNPSEIFLSERPMGSSGSVVTPTLEGTRPILVEIQALVSPCNFGVPRRTTIGIDSNRVSLLVAVLDKRAGIHILGQDIFMNVAGGVKIVEPAIDLGVSMSLVSSFLNKPIQSDLLVFGEVGLSGEIRGVSRVDLRLKEAEKLGFKQCILPRINSDRIKSSISSISLIGVNSIENAIDAMF